MTQPYRVYRAICEEIGFPVKLDEAIEVMRVISVAKEGTAS